MKNLTTLLISICLLSFLFEAKAQIDPLNSPYADYAGTNVVMDSIVGVSPENVLFFRPETDADGPYPTILFQPGANSGTEYINSHSYDLYWEHLASYGYVIIIIDNTEGGPNATLFTQTHDWIKDSIADANHWMHSYVDTSRFVVSGHSNGGMNATDIIIDRPNEIEAIIYMASYPNPGMAGMGAQDVTGYPGKVMFLNGDEDDTSVPLVGSTNEVSSSAYDQDFIAVDCKVWCLFEGIGHGGFGDYGNPDQPVGSIGRDSTTASVRHFIVSFMETVFKNNATASDNLNLTANQPATVLEFESSCVATSVTIEDSDYITYLGLYPNPASDMLQLEMDMFRQSDVEISINNLLGQEMIRQSFSAKEQLSARFNVSSLPEGAYFVKIVVADKTFTRKFIKN